MTDRSNWAAAGKASNKILYNPMHTARSCHDFSNTMPRPLKNKVRVFSPKLNKYVPKSVAEENKNVKNAYTAMRKDHNANSVNVCGNSNVRNDSKPFEASEQQSNCSKIYTHNLESNHNNWNEKSSKQATSNYESARFNIINHGNNKGQSILKMLKENPSVCHRIKGLTEICDLLRETAINPNKEYQKKIKIAPKCFYKVKTPYTTECEFRKTFNQFSRLYKK